MCDASADCPNYPHPDCNLAWTMERGWYCPTCGRPARPVEADDTCQGECEASSALIQPMTGYDQHVIARYGEVSRETGP